MAARFPKPGQLTYRGVIRAHLRDIKTRTQMCLNYQIAHPERKLILTDQILADLTAVNEWAQANLDHRGPYGP